ncbi:MAG: hypothetical protein IPL92_07455 [Saprospiraceae bacterium]|nr:hypothetical protein [Candidatus Opimibacter iunctus]
MAKIRISFDGTEFSKEQGARCKEQGGYQVTDLPHIQYSIANKEGKVESGD